MEKLSTEWKSILEERLVYSSESISTAFYMADRAFIDSLLRLRNFYHEASKDPFPLRQDAYPRLTEEDIAGGKRIYSHTAYCDFRDSDHLDPKYQAIDRFHGIWEAVLLRRLGPLKNFNANRIMIHYLYPDYDCFYPAEEFQKNTVTFNRK